MLSRLYDVTDGSVIVGGRDVREYDIDVIRNQVAVVLQNNVLFSGTILDNLRWGDKEATKEECMHACDLACASEFVEKLPKGYDTYIEQGGTNVSGGQKQRVAIAGVMAMRPKCIVLDEPTAMLDPNGRKEVLRSVMELRKREHITVILITHYMEEIIHADKVFVMDEGKIAMQGTPREIFSQVEQLKKLRLDVPQVTILADELRKRGLDIPAGVLKKEELVEILCRLN